MFIGIDDPGHKALVRAYVQAAELMQNTRIGGLSSLLHDAGELLNESNMHIAAHLRDVEVDLREDANDLQWRGDFLIEADAKLAFHLDVRLGELVNSHLAEVAKQHGWTYREANLRAELAALQSGSASEQIRHAARIREIQGHLALLVHSTEDAVPDRAGTLTTQRRAKFSSMPGTDATAGMRAIVEALEHTADPSRVADDEFEIVHLDNGKIILILPGVADLTDTVMAVAKTAVDTSKAGDLANAGGWNPEHHSARDTWIAASESAGSARVEDNLYAQLVVEYVDSALKRGEIAQGTEIMIVGHSYGADTAVDLAADPIFNGDKVKVTHVVAAAYHSEPQLEHVPETTSVAVVQNIKDLVILGEAMVDDDSGETSREVRASIGGIVTNAGIEAVNGIAEGIAEVGEVGAELATNTFREVTHSTSAERHEAVTYADYELDAPDIGKVRYASPATQVSDNIVLVEFDGGFEGLGHHQDNYNNYLKATTDPVMQVFFEDVATSGYTGDGLAWAVDVSVPEEMR